MKDDKPKKLKAFLGQLPEKVVRQLTAAVEMDRVSGGADLPHAMLLEGLRPTLTAADSQIFRTPTPMRLFCMPFEDLLLPTRDGPKQAGRIARSTLVPLWDWLAADLMPALYQDHCTRLSDAILANDNPKMRQIAGELHAAGAAAISRALSGAPVGSPRREEIAKLLGGEDAVADAEDIAFVLEAAPEILDLREQFVSPVRELDSELLGELRKQYELVSEHMPDSGRYLVVVAMSRLAKPWQILRAGAVLSKRMDDSLLSKTDLGLIGDILFGELDNDAAYFSEINSKTFDPEQALFRLVGFARLSQGITNELGIMKDGPWGQRLMKARKQASAALENLLEHLPDQIAAAMPLKSTGAYGSRRSLRPDLMHDPDPKVLARATNVATFMRESRPISGDAAFSAAHADSYDMVLDALNSYRGGLLSELRNCDDREKLSRARAYLDLTVELTAILVSEGEAQIFRRRGVLAERNDSVA